MTSEHITSRNFGWHECSKPNKNVHRFYLNKLLIGIQKGFFFDFKHWLFQSYFFATQNHVISMHDVFSACMQDLNSEVARGCLVIVGFIIEHAYINKHYIHVHI